MGNLFKQWNSISLVKRIIIGLIVGIILAVVSSRITPEMLATIENIRVIGPIIAGIIRSLEVISIFGSLFVGALKAVAPILVLFLVTSAISQHKSGQKTNMKTIVVLYLLGTFLAGLTAVIASFLFPVTLTLVEGAQGVTPPSGVTEVLKTLLMNIVSNPVTALADANYIGILAWAILLGLALKGAPDTTKVFIQNIADALAQIVKWVINLAPFGIMGLVFNTVSTNGIEALGEYGRLLVVLVGSMVFIALVVNPIIAFVMMRKNPYPLVFKCLKDSGITAFFTRSSAANIPVNMTLCEELGLDKDTYSVSIPLGATINMAGAAITISVLTLAAVNTLGIEVDLPTAIILSVLSAVSACGASGVAGGSLLLIPLACSLFGIPNDIAMQVVGVGFIVGVIQDSCETGLNSSTDALFTAVAEFAEWRKEGKEIRVTNAERARA